ncbi:EndoU domain-containing protein [Propionibacterium australiense]|uniref:Bacterial EndoU nuclease n=1 Tax=Propionibacterium australiense TaxID=119981 RepID=A0A383S859_9ACTN|nr:EndoU domain-containing protein [Propionibacterium australiense]RLP11092.1 hypothetical protein D7U36_04780 [Propionibacterium australiense]RLP12416.1 hypothetical protein D9T14_00785 [Propionibacterium australiense]SYZ34023.1 Bacterial EndoU nuclease [Propionibacterium australiense]VEH91375.1 Uncharacterised protein [Propionibacterium australiense]
MPEEPRPGPDEAPAGQDPPPPATGTDRPGRARLTPALSGDGRAYVTADGRRLLFGPADVHGLDEAREHVVEGSTRRSGRRTGGHLYATVEAERREGQIAFPRDWDADRIMAAARPVIDRPENLLLQGEHRIELSSTIDGVRLAVRIRLPKNGPAVVTVFPTGGVGVKRVHNGRLRDVG